MAASPLARRRGQCLRCHVTPGGSRGGHRSALPGPIVPAPVLFGRDLGDRGLPVARSVACRRPSVRAYASDVERFAEWAARGGAPGRPKWTGSCCAVTWRTWPPAATEGDHRPQGRLAALLLPVGARGALGGARTRRADCRTVARSRLPRVLGHDELRRACSTRPPRRRTGVPGTRCDRDDAVLELLYGGGLRVAELCGLDLGDLDLAGRTVTVTGKGNKQRQVLVHAPALRGSHPAWLDGPRAA